MPCVKKTPKLVEDNQSKGSRNNEKEDERVTNRGNEGTDSRLLPPGPGAAHFLQPLHVSQRLFRNSNAVNVERFRGQRVGTRSGNQLTDCSSLLGRKFFHWRAADRASDRPKLNFATAVPECISSPHKKKEE